MLYCLEPHQPSCEHKENWPEEKTSIVDSNYWK